MNALTRQRVLVDERTLDDFCARNHVRRLSLYGSVLRNDFRPDSDIDILVEFEPGHTPGLFGIGGMLLDLQEMFGRQVDLKTLGDFPERLRPSIAASSEPLYVAHGA